MKYPRSLAYLALALLAMADPCAADTLNPSAVDRSTSVPTPGADVVQERKQAETGTDLAAYVNDIGAIAADVKKIGDEHVKQEKLIVEVLKVNPFVRSETRELAFESDHSEMLDMLRRSADLVVSLDQLNTDAIKCTTKLASLRAMPAAGQYLGLEALSVKTTDLQSKIQADLNRVREHKSKINDTLIENVYRYNVKVSFRSKIGTICIAAFAVMIGVFSFLLWKKTLAVNPGATMQFIAVILIVFVILLFGITDVMGENGVTGLLAAIAGYILGKTTTGENANTEHIAEIIRAARGVPTTDTSEQADSDP